MANQGRGQPPHSLCVPQPWGTDLATQGPLPPQPWAAPATPQPRCGGREGTRRKAWLLPPKGQRGALRFARVCRATRPPPARKLMCARGVTCESH